MRGIYPLQNKNKIPTEETCYQQQKTNILRARIKNNDAQPILGIPPFVQSTYEGGKPIFTVTSSMNDTSSP